MPSVTRRQSGKLPPRPRLSQQRQREVSGKGKVDDQDEIMDGDLTELSSSDEDDFEEDEVDEEDVDEEEESDDAYDGASRPAKRQKTSKSKAARKVPAKASKAAPKPKGSNRKVRGRLEHMLTMPLDVLFELFSYLPPGDLLSLARTSKSLRAVLMSRGAASVWKASRSQAPGLAAPDPPDDLSEPAWAQLLYGPAVCSACGVRNIHRVDFALRRRLCTRCMKDKLVFSVKLGQKHPGMNPSVMDLLPYTQTGGWSHGHASNSRFYWSPDLVAMNAKVVALEKDPKALTALRKERILLVDGIMQDCARYEEWASKATHERAIDSMAIQDQRYDDIVGRLTASGFEMADIKHANIRLLGAVTAEKELTDKSWARIRKSVETFVLNGRASRLARERAHAVRARTNEAKKLYKNALRTYLPAQWFYLPTISQASLLPCFRDVIDQEGDLDSAAWTSAMERLPLDLSEWMEKKRDDCITMLPPAARNTSAMEVAFLSSSAIQTVRRDLMTTYAGRLELATSVFHWNSRLLIGRELCHSWKGEVAAKFAPTGAASATALVKLLGLDPRTTTAARLDEIDHRFACLTCARLPNAAADVHSWRSCVEHDVNVHGFTDPEKLHWRILDAQEAAAAKAGTVVQQPVYARVWFCNHCSLYYRDFTDWLHEQFKFENKATVLNHLHAVHDIRSAVENVDICYYVDPGEHLVAPIVHKAKVQPQAQPGPSQPAAIYRCMHCAPGPHPRLFQLGGVTSHIKAKHKPAGDLFLGIDYQK